MKSIESKFRTVIDQNTFYFSDRVFEEKYEGHLSSVRETLLVFKNSVENSSLRKELIEKLLQKENGLTALLALTGFSYESLKQLITVIRVVDDLELSRLVLKDEWCPDEPPTNIRAWGDKRIEKMILQNEHFRKGIVNIFFEGATVPLLARILPLFELKKLSICKLNFEVPAMIDTLVRYKEKGSYSVLKGNKAESVIKGVLDELVLPFEKGDLDKFAEQEQDSKRSMDFIIPSKQKPQIVIECSFVETTGSGQGDKAKTEINISRLIKTHYPNAKFIGFLDGIGWYVRPQDLMRMVTAYEDVFTFHQEEIARFKEFLRKEFQK